ncbi:MAG TPA: UpxY family transcription antiterminator [Candidatus Acidoferrales bacterium]|nr:UpxY family transcription antiterminator [Candidatus Acidoferrales bacterium]
MNSALPVHQLPLDRCFRVPALAARSETLRWYAIRTRSRSEKIVNGQLCSHGLETFLPIYTECHRWSDRRKEINLPLFPGYTFLRAKLSAEIRSLVLRVAGAMDFVTSLGKPLAVDDHEIEDIQLLSARGIRFSPCAFVNVGTRVRVRGGALDGVVGILVGRNSDCSLVISVELIRRSIALRVQGYEVCPV